MYIRHHELQDMRKQSKPEVYLDHYLSTIGLWRKPVARDGLCLFRAVSEQLFMTQAYHTNLYEACKIVFIHCGKDMSTDWTEQMVMTILSKMYRREIYVYEDVGQPPTQMTFNNYKTKLLLCRTSNNQLDSVYPASFQQNSAICQSIVYELLYRDVFQLDTELTDAVTVIRDQNKKKMSLLSNRFDDLPETVAKRSRELPVRFKDRYAHRPTPPLPYRIAKALDPFIYRNVELDIWEEDQREQKRESQEHRDKFAPGDKCQVIVDGDRFCGYIQEIDDENNTAIVFLEELGEKQTFGISCLKTPSLTRHSCYLRHKFQRQKHIVPTNSSTLSGKSYYDRVVPASVYQSHYCTPSPLAADLNHTQSSELNQGYTLGQVYCMGDTRMTNLNNPCVRMDTAAVQGGLQNVKTNLNQYTSSMLQQYAVPNMGQGAMQQGGYMYGPVVPPNNSGYACVCVPYLDSIAVKDVNINCPPSQDTTGKDLPEVNTLRFFYNLGVENYRNMSQTGPTWQAVEVAPMLQSADQLNGNVCGQYALPPPPLAQTSSPNSDTDGSQQIANQNYLMCSSYPGTVQNKPSPLTGSPTLNQTKYKASIGDESHDSGCDSDSASGTVQDESFKETDDKLKLKSSSMELEQKIDSYIATDDVEVMEAESVETVTPVIEYTAQTNTTKTKKPRKYYMWGTHKLIKPIKDIPPRFLSLLQSSSAERARCEGEPIIIPFNTHKYHHRYHKNTHDNNSVDKKSVVSYTGFNPEAKCFIPGQSSQSVMQDPSIVACSAGPKNGQAIPSVDPYTTTPENFAYNPYSAFGNGSAMYINSQAYSQTNPGIGIASNSAVTNYNNSSNFGDGSKFSMPPSLLTGQTCPSYAPSMQYPMYYAGQAPYTGNPGLMPPPAGLPGQVTYSTAYHQSQAYGMPPQVTHVPAVQAAQ